MSVWEWQAFLYNYLRWISNKCRILNVSTMAGKETSKLLLNRIAQRLAATLFLFMCRVFQGVGSTSFEEVRLQIWQFMAEIRYVSHWQKFQVKLEYFLNCAPQILCLRLCGALRWATVFLATSATSSLYTLKQTLTTPTWAISLAMPAGITSSGTIMSRTCLESCLHHPTLSESTQ